MFRRTRTEKVRDNAVAVADLATALAKDKKFRKELLKATKHGVLAKRRAAARIGVLAAVTRLASDEELRREARKVSRNLQSAWGRVERSAAIARATSC